MIITGFVIWIAETAYFGFNLKAISGVERFFDVFSTSLILVGCILNICDNIFKPRDITINIDQSLIDFIKNSTTIKK